MRLPDMIKRKIQTISSSFLEQFFSSLSLNVSLQTQPDVQFNLVPKLRERCKQLNKRQVKAYRNSKSTKKNNRRKTYRSYSASFKQKTVKEIKVLLAKSELPLSKLIRYQSQKLKIATKNIYRWCKMQKFQQRKCHNRVAKYPKMEKYLVQFIKRNPHTKRKDITSKAKQILRVMHPENCDQFSFSQGWFQKFKLRHKQSFLIKKKYEQKCKNFNNQLESQMQDQKNMNSCQADESIQVQFVQDDNEFQSDSEQIEDSKLLTKMRVHANDECQSMSVQFIQDQSQSIFGKKLSESIIQQNK